MPYYITPETSFDVIKIFVFGVLAFIFAFWLAPMLISFLYKHKMWRKKVRDKTIDGKELYFFKKFHSHGEIHTPRFGGVLIWTIPLILASLFFLLSKTDIWLFKKLNFLSRGQTWLPLFALVSASLVGLVDDVSQVVERPKKGILKNFWNKKEYIAGGLKLKTRLILIFFIGLAGGLWFYFKLGWDTIHIPGNGDVFIGFWYIPLFILVMLAVYSGGVIDGLDGLSGGVFISIFGAYAAIALFLGQINIAAFCAAILGALLAFLWFNIPPAKFYMGETGMMGLCATLTVIAFLTDSVLVLPIIGLLLAVESGSLILQLISKKLRNKKIFLASPIHHHFEAKGWPHYKITMRFWLIGIVVAIIGVAIRFLG